MGGKPFEQNCWKSFTVSVLVESDGAFDFLDFDCFFCFLAMLVLLIDGSINIEFEVISLWIKGGENRKWGC